MDNLLVFDKEGSLILDMPQDVIDGDKDVFFKEWESSLEEERKPVYRVDNIEKDSDISGYPIQIQDIIRIFVWKDDDNG